MLDHDFALQFLNKLIEDTKNKKLLWQSYSVNEKDILLLIEQIANTNELFGKITKSSLMDVSHLKHINYYKAFLSKNMTLRIYKAVNGEIRRCTLEYIGAGSEVNLIDVDDSEVSIASIRLYNIVESLHDEFLKSVDLDQELKDYVFPKT